MVPLEEVKKKIIDKQRRRCYRCDRLFDVKYETLHSIFLYNQTTQNQITFLNPASTNQDSIIALCDVCHYTSKSRAI